MKIVLERVVFMETLLSYLSVERCQGWTLGYRAVQHSRAGSWRTSNFLSFSSSLPRFQEPGRGPPVSAMLPSSEGVLSRSTPAAWSLSGQLVPVQETATGCIPPALRLDRLLWYTLSLFSWKREKWNILMLFSFPKLKLLRLFAGLRQYQSIWFSEVQEWYCISQHYLHYIPKAEVTVEPIQRENLASFEVNASPVIKVIHGI